MTQSDEVEAPRNPLQVQWERRRDMRHEIDLLRSQSDEAILAKARTVPGFVELEQIYDFRVDRSNPDTLQLSFGTRSMFRPAVDRKKTAAESGPTLVYSLGPTGEMATILYPVRSDLGRTREDHIFLQIGARSGIKLVEGLQRDLKLLVSYAHVSSIDMTASLGERSRIWLVRQLCHRGEEGKFQKAPFWGALLGLSRFGSRTFTTALFLSVLRPLGLALLLGLLAWLGWDWLSDLVPRR
jgi:hypothetical protein